MADMNQDFEALEFETLFVTLEDDTEQECAVLDSFEMDGKEYLVMTTLTKDGMPDTEELFFAKKLVDETCAEDECIIDFMEDEEYDTVAKYYDLLLDEIEEEEKE